MGWNGGSRQINAEESVLPLRSVVILIVGLLSLMGAAITVTSIATGQWDKTQTAIANVQATADKAVKDQTEFRTYIASLILTKGTERDAQLAKINSSIINLSTSLDSNVADLNVKVADLTAKFATLRTIQDSTREETAKTIKEIRAQIDDIMKDISVLKCKLPGSDKVPGNSCGKSKP